MAKGDLMLVNGKLEMMLQPGGYSPRYLVIDSGNRYPQSVPVGGDPNNTKNWKSVFTAKPLCYVKIWDSNGNLDYYTDGEQISDVLTLAYVSEDDGVTWVKYTPSWDVRPSDKGNYGTVTGNGTFEAHGDGITLTKMEVVGIVHTSFDTNGHVVTSPIVHYAADVTIHQEDDEGVAELSWSFEVCWPLFDLGLLNIWHEYANPTGARTGSYIIPSYEVQWAWKDATGTSADGNPTYYLPIPCGNFGSKGSDGKTYRMIDNLSYFWNNHIVTDESGNTTSNSVDNYITLSNCHFTCTY